MRRILVVSALLALSAACAHTSDRASTTTTTGADIPAAPLEIRPELRVSTAVCNRLEACGYIGRSAVLQSSAECVRAMGRRASVQMSRWDCTPAATRARFEECLTGFAEEPCTTIVDRATRGEMCRANTACGI